MTFMFLRLSDFWNLGTYLGTVQYRAEPCHYRQSNACVASEPNVITTLTFWPATFS